MSALIRLWTAVRALLSAVVLLAAYALVVTPVGLVSQLVRADPLQRGRPAAETWWETREPEARESFLGFLADRGKLWLVPVVGILLLTGLAVLVSESSLILAFLYPLF